MSKAIDIIFIASGLIVATAVLSAPFTGSQRAAEPLPLAVTGVEAGVQQEDAQEPEIDWSDPPWDPAPVVKSSIPVLRAVHTNGMRRKIRRVVQN